MRVSIGIRTTNRQRMQVNECSQCNLAKFPQHFLNFLPLPHGHSSLRPSLGSSLRKVMAVLR